MYNCDSHIHCVFVVVIVANIIFSDQNTVNLLLFFSNSLVDCSSLMTIMQVV